MARYQVIIAYDGAPFAGFQRQAQAKTVQGEIEAALSRIGWRGQSILAAGRTDAGVHALGQVAAFDFDWNHPPGDLLLALNANLPAEISARAVSLASPNFHPRYDATARIYRYSLLCDPVRHPLAERFAWRVWPCPDLNRMQTAASSLVGRHDFAAFGTAPVAGGSTLRTVFEAEWQQVESPAQSRLEFEIRADAFLFRMVRRIVGLLVDIGLGFQDPAVIAQLLETPPAGPIQWLAPAAGLCLQSVSYPLAVTLE